MLGQRGLRETRGTSHKGCRAHEKEVLIRSDRKSSKKICIWQNYKAQVYGIYMWFIIQRKTKPCPFSDSVNLNVGKRVETPVLFPFPFHVFTVSLCKMIFLCDSKTQTKQKPHKVPPLCELWEWVPILYTRSPQNLFCPYSRKWWCCQIKYLLTNKLLYCLSQVSTHCTSWTSESTWSLPHLGL